MLAHPRVWLYLVFKTSPTNAGKGLAKSPKVMAQVSSGSRTRLVPEPGFQQPLDESSSGSCSLFSLAFASPPTCPRGLEGGEQRGWDQGPWALLGAGVGRAVLSRESNSRWVLFPCEGCMPPTSSS